MPGLDVKANHEGHSADRGLERAEREHPQLDPSPPIPPADEHHRHNRDDGQQQKADNVVPVFDKSALGRTRGKQLKHEPDPEEADSPPDIHVFEGHLNWSLALVTAATKWQATHNRGAELRKPRPKNP